MPPLKRMPSKLSIAGSMRRLDLIHEAKNQKPIVYPRDRRVWTALVCNVMMFHSKLEIEDLFEYMLTFYGDHKCRKIYTTSDELLTFIKERCSPFLQISEEEKEGEKKIFIIWNGNNSVWMKRLIDLANTALLETPNEEEEPIEEEEAPIKEEISPIVEEAPIVEGKIDGE